MAMNPPPVYPAWPPPQHPSAAEPTFTAAVASDRRGCGRGAVVAGAITTALAMKTTPAPQAGPTVVTVTTGPTTPTATGRPSR